jgi:hypothetical protein
VFGRELRLCSQLTIIVSVSKSAAFPGLAALIFVCSRAFSSPNSILRLLGLCLRNHECRRARMAPCYLGLDFSNLWYEGNCVTNSVRSSASTRFGWTIHCREPRRKPMQDMAAVYPRDAIVLGRWLYHFLLPLNAAFQSCHSESNWNYCECFREAAGFNI